MNTLYATHYTCNLTLTVILQTYVLQNYLYENLRNIHIHTYLYVTIRNVQSSNTPSFLIDDNQPWHHIVCNDFDVILQLLARHTFYDLLKQGAH